MHATHPSYRRNDEAGTPWLVGLVSGGDQGDAHPPQGRAREGSDQLDRDRPSEGLEGVEGGRPGAGGVAAAQVFNDEDGGDHAENEAEGQANKPADNAADGSPHERGLRDSRLVHTAGGDHVFQDHSEEQDGGGDGEDDPRGARAGHPRPHEDRTSDDGRGGPNLHDRSDHSDEDDNADDDGSEDAHAAIIRARSTPLKKAATNFDCLCYFE